jgi:hypothetical protein
LLESIISGFEFFGDTFFFIFFFNVIFGVIDTKMKRIDNIRGFLDKNFIGILLVIVCKKSFAGFFQDSSFIYRYVTNDQTRAI